MNILLTGASGFLGSYIYHELARENKLTTVGRTAVGNRHIHCDLAEQVPELPDMAFDIVVNVAGKAHSVPRNALERSDYQRVNVQGTANLLAALKNLSSLPIAIVHISSVLVYGCLDGQLLPETTPIQASDVYGLSKARAETVMCDWAKQMDIRLAVLRLPLVASGQPTGNLAMLQKAIRYGYYVRIGNGSARRSMVRADDVAAIITRAAAVGGIFNLTDGCHPAIRELENSLACQARRKRPIPMVPLSVAKAVAHLGDGVNAVTGRRFPFDTIALRKLTNTLTFSDDLARQQLNWNPRPVLDLFR